MAMDSSRRRLGRAALLGAAMALLLAPAGAGADSPVEPVPVATGLDNPKGITFGADGSLYVAEAGIGDPASFDENGEPVSGARCIPNPEGGLTCLGATGAVTRVRAGVQERIVSGLPSLAGPGGFAAAGPHDVSLQGNGTILVPIGLGGNPAVTAPGGVLAGTGIGTLLRVNGKSGTWTTVADIAAFEGANNPGQEPDVFGDFGPPGGLLPPDSNPFGVLALPGRTLVVDAGANAVFSVTPSGATSTFAVFGPTLADPPPFIPLPPGTQIPAQAVPTAIAQGPDGLFYVGQLTGFPFPVDGAKVFVLDGSGAVVDEIDGFTNIVDVTVGPDGSLYVVEISSSGLLSGQMDGQVWKVAPDGTRTLVVPFVFAPGGAAVGPDGDLYVTSGTILPGYVPAPDGFPGGAVLRFDLP